MRLSHVSVVYSDYGLFSKADDVVALHDVSLDVARGEKLAVLGRNGAGKSTLLRIMSGVMDPDIGSVDHRGLSRSLLSLNAGFDPGLSGVHNVVMHGMLTGLSRREAMARVPAVAEMSGLGDAMRRRMSTYSSGMRGRLCFSAAINLEPDILLIDEVFSVGDREFRERSLKVMVERFRKDKTVVFVTHNVNVVRDLCNRAVWLDDGRIRAEGDVDDVATEYRAATTQAA